MIHEEIINTISLKMYETEDKFIMETILPYCSQIEQTEISKKELIEAFEKQKAKKPEIEIYTNRVPSEQKVYVCPVCGEYLGDCHDWFYKHKFCPECGQRLNWSWEE